jgi:hypothetical protein
MDNDMTPWSSVSTIRELDLSELTDGLLAYTGSKNPDQPSSDTTPDPSRSVLAQNLENGMLKSVSICSPPVADASETETAQTGKPPR